MRLLPQAEDGQRAEDPVTPILISCTLCGKLELWRGGRRRKYCVEHAIEVQRNRIKMYQASLGQSRQENRKHRICLGCGSALACKARGNQRLRCRSCKDRNDANRAKVRRLDMAPWCNCLQCQTRFKLGKKRVFCSKRCSEKFHEKSNRGKREEVRAIKRYVGLPVKETPEHLLDCVKQLRVLNQEIWRRRKHGYTK